MLRKAERLAVVSLLSIGSSACGSGGDGEHTEVASDAQQGISWEALRQSATLAPNGSLVVEGDMAFRNEAELRRFWEEDRAPRDGQRLTVNTRVVGGITVDDVWGFPDKFNLTYCVGTGFTSTQLDQLLPALDAATIAWSRIVGVQFRRVTPPGTCDSSNNNVVFDVQRATTGSWFGFSFFPADPRSSRTLFLDDTAFTTTSGGRTLTGIATHELGHSLGYRHEHIWTACSGESTANARQVTAYDQASVMHYPQCRTPTGGGYSVSALDYAGGVSLYGLAPALIAAAL